MTDTPNTSRQSEAARMIAARSMNRFTRCDCDDCIGPLAIEIDAALARAREEARREALQDAKFAAEATGRVVTDGLARLGRYEHGYARARADIEYAIHSLLTPTPQGESRVDQKRPPSPEDLVDALQDRVHPASGPLIQSKPVTPQGETKEQQT